MSKPLIFGLFAMLAIACNSKQAEAPKPTAPIIAFTNVVILGNSITYSPANPTDGWPGSWGMAASKAELDYVHLLTRHFVAQNAACKLSALNISAFERDAQNFDFDANLKALRDAKPDLLIMRIGENVMSTTDKVVFEKRYVELLNYFSAANPNIKIMAAGPFWPNPEVEKILGNHSPFISLSALCQDPDNEAGALFSDPGIAIHPGDKGMQAISNAIWAKVATLQ